MSNLQRQATETTPLLRAGGTLQPGKDLYIKRPQDERVLHLLMSGNYVNILTSRQMGKSSLVMQALRRLTAEGIKWAYVDLAAELGSEATATAEAYYQGLLAKIRRGLMLDLDVSAWWAARRQDTLNQRFLAFFREVVGEQISAPVVVFLDEIDSTLKLRYTDDLFTALRGMVNERSLVEPYARLTFCLIGVATPNELIQDRRTTPYNVGETVALRDFDSAEDDLTPLAQNLAADLNQGWQLLERVLHWTGGHPYLTLKLCHDLKVLGIADGAAIDRHVRECFANLDQASADDVHFQAILRFVEERFTQGLKSLRLYERILSGARERDQPTLAHAELKLSGLVKRRADGCLAVRNRLYQRLFDQRWINSQAPVRDARSYRRRAIGASAATLAVVVVAAVWQLVFIRPEVTKLETEVQRREAEVAVAREEISARERLAELGITITQSARYHGNRLAFRGGSEQEVLEEAIPLFETASPVVELSLADTQVTDLSPLIELKSLRALDLSRTEITDLRPLANLSALEEVRLGSARSPEPTATGNARSRSPSVPWPVADLSPLSGLRYIHLLEFPNTQVADLRPLANLTNLQRLNLGRSQVIDISPLYALHNLEELNMSETDIINVSPLASLVKLRDLRIGGDFEDSWLNWTSFPAERRRVSDLSFLADLTELKQLDLTDIQVADIRPLTGLTNLEWLDLWNTGVADASPLANLDNLFYLNLGATAVTDLSSVAGLINLDSLYLATNQITDISGLAGLINLRFLSLRETPVADVEALSGLTNLQDLDLNTTEVKDVEALSGLTNLQTLNLNGTPVSPQDVARLKDALAARGNRSVRILHDRSSDGSENR